MRVRWAGRRPRLWRSVIKELEIAEELTRDNDVLTLTMCVNYGGRAEIADAAAAIAREVAAGRLKPDKVDEETVARFLDEPDMPDVDLFVRSSGENRTSNFLLWQSAYAELVFLDTLWPDFDRRHLWQAVRGVRLPAAPLRQRLRDDVSAVPEGCRFGSAQAVAGPALRTGADDLQGVADVGEAVLTGDPVGPRLDRRPGDLDGAAAHPADQVVVVLGAAAAVERLAGVGADRVQLAVVGQRLDGAVDRRQPHPVAGVPGSTRTASRPVAAASP